MKLQIKIRDVAVFWQKVICIIVILFVTIQIISLGFMEYPILFSIFLVAAAAMLTAKEYVTIDMTRRVITEGYWILGMRTKDETEFSELEKVFINSVNLAATTTRYMTGSTRENRWTTFKAFLKTAEGEKIAIGMSTDKNDLIARLIRYNQVLKTTIVDTSNPHEPVLITRD